MTENVSDYQITIKIEPNNLIWATFTMKVKLKAVFHAYHLLDIEIATSGISSMLHSLINDRKLY